VLIEMKARNRCRLRAFLGWHCGLHATSGDDAVSQERMDSDDKGGYFTVAQLTKLFNG